MKKITIMLLIGMLALLGSVVYYDYSNYEVEQYTYVVDGGWHVRTQVWHTHRLVVLLDEPCRNESVDSLRAEQNREMKIFILNLKQLSNGHK